MPASNFLNNHYFVSISHIFMFLWFVGMTRHKSTKMLTRARVGQYGLQIMQCYLSVLKRYMINLAFFQISSKEIHKSWILNFISYMEYHIIVNQIPQYRYCNNIFGVTICTILKFYHNKNFYLYIMTKWVKRSIRTCRTVQ